MRKLWETERFFGSHPSDLETQTLWRACRYRNNYPGHQRRNVEQMFYRYRHLALPRPMNAPYTQMNPFVIHRRVTEAYKHIEKFLLNSSGLQYYISQVSSDPFARFKRIASTAVATTLIFSGHGYYVNKTQDAPQPVNTPLHRHDRDENSFEHENDP